MPDSLSQSNSEFEKEYKSLYQCVKLNTPILSDHIYVKNYDDFFIHTKFSFRSMSEFIDIIEYPYPLENITNLETYEFEEGFVFLNCKRNFFTVLRAWIFINRDNINRKLEFGEL